MSIANAAHHSMIGKVAGGIKFIPYAASDGTACIVVPHVQQNVNDAEVSITLKSPSNPYSVLRSKNLFGYSLNDSKWVLNNYNDGSSSRMEFQLYSGTAFVGRIIWQEVLLAGNTYTIDMKRKSGYVTLSVNGEQRISRAKSGTPVQGRYGLFTQNDINGDAVNPIRGRTPANVPVSAFDTWDGGALVTSLRPCIDPGGVVCFFDLVSNQYIYSVSGGSFVAVYQ